MPPIESFYNKLNECNISKEDYERAQKVYILEGCKKFKDYLDLYLKTDVILLADVMENFRYITYKYYGLELTSSYTAPGFSWQAMLLGYFRVHNIKDSELVKEF